MLATLEGHIFMVVYNHWNSGLNNWTEILVLPTLRVGFCTLQWLVTIAQHWEETMKL